MMVISFRMRYAKMMVAIGCALLLVVGVAFWWQYSPPVSQVFSVFRGNKAEVKCADNDERVAYLQSAGWEVSAEPVGALEVVIPEEFDAVYEGYCLIQEKQGFRMEKYKGHTATKYTYSVTNYPDGEQVLANLIVYKDRIIAADLCSAQLGGFIKELKVKV